MDMCVWVPSLPCCPICAVALRSLDDLDRLERAGDLHPGEVLYEYAALRAFPDAQVARVWLDQVLDRFIVDLDVGEAHLKLVVLLLAQPPEQIVHRPRDDPALIAVQLSHHRVRLPGASLPVREDSPIEPLHNALGKITRQL